VIEIPKGFWFTLSKHPTDWTTQLVIADWCEDHDDLEQAKAWRYLVKNKKAPYHLDFGSNRWGWADYKRICKEHMCYHGLPWKIIKDHKRFKNHRESLQWAISELIKTKWIKNV
jgi:uncharacterized protein (TIGR02996 family)